MCNDVSHAFESHALSAVNAVQDLCFCELEHLVADRARDSETHESLLWTGCECPDIQAPIVVPFVVALQLSYIDEFGCLSEVRRLDATEFDLRDGVPVYPWRIRSVEDVVRVLVPLRDTDALVEWFERRHHPLVLSL